MTVGIAIPVLNGAVELRYLLPLLLAEPNVARILVVDSNSTDGTSSVVMQHPGVGLHVLKQGEFNHGTTRELARKLLGTDIVVYLTQDVRPESGFLGPLVSSILAGGADASYSRQLPHLGADVFEAFPRHFNYSDQEHFRTLEDVGRYGAYTFFCSDSCAAYRQSALDEIGGFTPTLVCEDYIAVARLLVAGRRIHYAAASRVRHSHSYTLLQEFRRYFDTGYIHAENPWIGQLIGRAEGRGARFASRFIREVAANAPLLLPYAMVQLGVKWVGYRAGKIGHRLPVPMRKRLSSQPYYWRIGGV